MPTRAFALAQSARLAALSKASATAVKVHTVACDTYAATAAKVHTVACDTYEKPPRIVSKVMHAALCLAVTTVLLSWTVVTRLIGLIAVLIPTPVKLRVRRLLKLPLNNESLLISIRFSHCVEKARWALDLLADQTAAQLINTQNHNNINNCPSKTGKSSANSVFHYTELSTAPVCHLFYTLLYSGGRSGSTPLFITRSNRALFESTDILHFVDDELKNAANRSDVEHNTTRHISSLYPVLAVSDLEDYFNRELGPSVRRLFWSLLLNNQQMTVKQTVHQLFISATPINSFERRLHSHPMFHRAVRYLMSKKFKTSGDAYEQSLTTVRSVIERVNGLLIGRDEKRVFLLDTPTITAADITFAALLSPLIFPSQLSDVMPLQVKSDSIGPEAFVVVEEIRNSRAGKFAMRLYEQHRGTKQVQIHEFQPLVSDKEKQN